MGRNLLIVSLIAFSAAGTRGQSTWLPLNEDYYHRLGRYEVASGKVAPEVFTSLKPYKRNDAVAYLDSLPPRGVAFSSRSDAFNREYLLVDNWEWSRTEARISRKPFMKYLYKNKADLLFADQPDFDIHVNPVLYLAGGLDSRQDVATFVNARGLEIRGIIDRKLGFYTSFTENQAVLPSFVQDFMNDSNSPHPVIPHEGFWKTFKDNGVDFFQARGYLAFNATKHIDLSFGHDRFQVGNGYRSLAFSDFGPPVLFFKGNLKIWKLNYAFQLSRMTADVVKNGSDRYPQKFAAFHHFSINIGKKVNLGLFEAVVFNAEDSSGGSFEWSYLNPVIFYRAIEQQNGSADNAMLGLDARWMVVPGVSVYGQFLLDEFNLDEVTAGNGWWANKYGAQVGFNYVNVAGISNLDLQAEANWVRPYTYSHYTDYGNYSNYLQSMAHPLGSNFNEWVAIVRYQPLPRLSLTLKSFFARTGRDDAGENWGGDILKNNSTRENDYGNTIGQGAENRIAFADFTASWMLKHNVFVDFKQVFRRSESALSYYNTDTSLTGLAFRWNIPQRLYDF